MPDIHVLLVDDEEDFLRPLGKRLARRSVAVSKAYSGPEALEFLRTNQVDVVVMDMRMPGMDGLETLQAIKGRHPSQEVIMLTGLASLEAALQGMEYGAFDYLMKPIDIEELLFKIEDAYKQKTLRKE